MFPENPGVGLFRRHVIIVETVGSAVGMAKAMPRIVDLGERLLRGEPLGPPAKEGYIPRGFKENVVTSRLAGERAIDLLLKKLRGEPVVSEITFPESTSLCRPRPSATWPARP